MLYGSMDVVGVALSAWRTRLVMRHVRPGPVVDLACGDNRLVKRLGRGTGIDIVNHGGADLVCTDFSSLPFADRSVSTVTILAALNYFDRPKEVLREIKRILTTDGVLIVTLLDKRVSSLWHRLRDRGLPRVAYSETELLELLRGTGLALRRKDKFMLGVNCAYLIERDPQEGKTLQ